MEAVEEEEKYNIAKSMPDKPIKSSIKKHKIPFASGTGIKDMLIARMGLFKPEFLS